MLTTLGDTLYVYQGQELGMKNIPPSWGAEEYKDVESIDYRKKYVQCKNNIHRNPSNKGLCSADREAR